MQTPRLTRISTAAVAVLATALLALLPSAALAKTCSLGSKGRKLGPTYTTSLSVSGTSCGSGEKLVTAYYRCRVKHGGKAKGTCRSKVLGYRCSQKVTSKIPTEFNARVSCSKGHARVQHTYEQFT